MSLLQCHQFVEDGFVLVPEVFARETAEEGCAVVWDAIGRHARGWSSPDCPVAWFDNFVHLQYGFPGFAADKPARDLGWHVDSDERHPTLHMPEKAVVAIPYFSDVGPGDGGTAVFPGSHLDVARILADAHPLALNDDDVRPRTPRPTNEGEIVEITGQAGDVLFAHPLLVHASNRNIGRRVRFACNPHVDLVEPLVLDGAAAEQSLVEKAVALALA